MSLLAHLHRHDRAIVVALLLGVMLVSWLYLLVGVEMPMPEMAGMAMPMAAAEWTIGHAFLMFIMWSAMMAVMMLPSAAPMLLFYDSIARKRSGPAIGLTILFAAGYLIVWLCFSIGAVFLQYALDMANLLSPLMHTTSIVLAGLILVAAGLYQWTPLKDACLRQCQAPWWFIQRHGGFRADAGGALALGARHGGYCIGCCWALMALLFVGGVMNVVWISALAILVLAEKVVPAGRVLSRIAGAGLVAAGAWLIVQAP